MTLNNQFHFTRLCFLIAVSVISINQLSAQPNFPTKSPDRIVLNLTEDSSTSMAVTWRTDTTVHTSYCELQPASNSRINSKESKSFKAQTRTMEYSYESDPVVHANQHSYILTGLKPGSKYIYRVGNVGNWSDWFQFQTPSNVGNEFSFIYFGDFQDPQPVIKSDGSRVIRKAYQESPNSGFMLYAGDLIDDPDRDTEWQRWFDFGSFIFASTPQIMTPGNHEYEGRTLDSHWNSQFTLPKNGPSELEGTCFFVDYEDLRLISINSVADDELRDKSGVSLKSQEVWLDSILSNNPKKWTILTSHLPFYSTKETRDNPQIRKHFQPIIEKHGVDMVLTGHDHTYGRGTASDNPNIKPSIVYVVSVGGPKFYKVGGNKRWMQKSISDTQLYQVISIKDNVLSFKAYSASGKLLDELKLKKKKDGTNKLYELMP